MANCDHAIVNKQKSSMSQSKLLLLPIEVWAMFVPSLMGTCAVFPPIENCAPQKYIESE
jgi:hypothetical protein